MTKSLLYIFILTCSFYNHVQIDLQKQVHPQVRALNHIWQSDFTFAYFLVQPRPDVPQIPSCPQFPTSGSWAASALPTSSSSLAEVVWNVRSVSSFEWQCQRSNRSEVGRESREEVWRRKIQIKSVKIGLRFRKELNEAELDLTIFYQKKTNQLL